MDRKTETYKQWTNSSKQSNTQIQRMFLIFLQGDGHQPNQAHGLLPLHWLHHLAGWVTDNWRLPSKQPSGLVTNNWRLPVEYLKTTLDNINSIQVLLTLAASRTKNILLQQSHRNLKLGWNHRGVYVLSRTPELEVLIFFCSNNKKFLRTTIRSESVHYPHCMTSV